MKPDFKTIWKNKKEILAGIKNTVIKNQEIEKIAELRYSICKECPSFSTDCKSLITECCGICGCSLNYKTRSLKSSCPINKWPSLEK
jgi:hypothetical protein